jgi:hypothetical protein
MGTATGRPHPPTRSETPGATPNGWGASGPRPGYRHGDLLLAIAAKAPRAARSIACRNAPIQAPTPGRVEHQGRHVESFIGAEEGTRHEPTRRPLPRSGGAIRISTGLDVCAPRSSSAIQAHLPSSPTSYSQVRLRAPLGGVSRSPRRDVAQMRGFVRGGEEGS